MKDNFSNQSELYAKYRPDYPAELFQFIVQHVPKHKLAWDCATGSGQAAKILSSYFEKVYASDISEQQLKHATLRPNIEYVKASAEASLLPDGVVDLVTVSQALHWFHFDDFYKEVKRVGNKDGIIAVWIYRLITINPEIDKLFHHYHFDIMGKYYDDGRQHVDNGYVNIPFPFKQIDTPPFAIKMNWSVEDFEGYLHTSSAVQKYIKVHGQSPVPDFMVQIKKLWPEGKELPVEFPVQLKMGNIH